MLIIYLREVGEKCILEMVVGVVARQGDLLAVKGAHEDKITGVGGKSL